MSRMHSQRTQCCCCASNIFFMLFGILMLSTGASLVLNYGQLEVDTGGLPPELQNEEGKRIVGIILICCGFSSMGISALMGVLYFTVCSRHKPPRNAITPNASQAAVSSKTSAEKNASGTSAKKETGVSDAAGNYSFSVHQPKQKHQKRSRKKRNNHNNRGYKNPLTPHPEFDEDHRGGRDSAGIPQRPSSKGPNQPVPTVVVSVSSIVGEVQPFLGPVEVPPTIVSYSELLEKDRGSESTEHVPNDVTVVEPTPNGVAEIETAGAIPEQSPRTSEVPRSQAADANIEHNPNRSGGIQSIGVNIEPTPSRSGEIQMTSVTVEPSSSESGEFQTTGL